MAGQFAQNAGVPKVVRAPWGARTVKGAAIGHIEIDKTMRSQGLGRVLARELLQELVDRDQPAVLTCSFMRKVAREDPVFLQGFL